MVKANAAETAGDLQLLAKYNSLVSAARQDIVSLLSSPTNTVFNSQEFQSVEPCPDGYIDLFHRTDTASVTSILKNFTMRSEENTNEAFFSTFNGTEADAQGDGYGEAAVWIRVPEDEVEVDDEFPSGEEHYRVPFSALTQSVFMIPNEYGLYQSAALTTVSTDTDPLLPIITTPTIVEITTQIREQFPGVDVYLTKSNHNNTIVINRIVVDINERSSGKGTAIMNTIVHIADTNGWTVALSPSSDFGGSKPRLIEFYKRFGFVQNKGHNIDYEISEDMYRLSR